MQYLGGKSRISKQISEVISEMRYQGGKSRIAKRVFEKSFKKNKTNVISIVDETGKELLKEYKK